MKKQAETYKLAFLGNQIVPFSNAQLHIASSAVLYGLSVYTVFPVTKTDQGLALFRLPDHYRRLKESCHIIGLDTFADHWSYERFKSTAIDLVKKNNIADDCFVRASIHVDAISPGARSRGLSVSLSMFMLPAVYILPAKGARLKASVWRRVSDNAIPARAKVNGAYVNSVLAKQDALDSGYDDCLFLDAGGHVCELSAANIFIVRDGTLITPGATSDLLEGINRKTVIELAKDLSLKVVERSIDLTEVYIADEAFACGTSAGITPITNVDSRTIGSGKIGEVTSRLQGLHKKLLHNKHPRSNDLLTLVT